MSTAGWFGDRAVLVETGTAQERDHVHAALTGSGLPGSVRTGLTAVLLEIDTPDPGLLDSVRAVLADAVPQSTSPLVAQRTVEIAVSYDGSDLDQVAHDLGVTAEALVRAHSSQSWRVAMMGFAPGFGYLEPVGEMLVDWAVLGRRASPRNRVPAGSVAVAAGMSAVYPQPMPGGWHLLGSTDAVLFDASAVDRPSLLQSGDTVRFVPTVKDGAARA